MNNQSNFQLPRKPPVAMYTGGMSALGTILRGQRRALKLTQQQLADRVGVTKSYIGQLEVQDGIEPSRDVVEKLAAALQVEVARLEHAIRARIDAPEMYLQGEFGPDEYWQAALKRHGGDVEAARRFVYEVLGESFD